MEKQAGVLNQVGLKYGTDKSSAGHGYLDFYEQHLPGRSFEGRLLEIGIWKGASLRMWREYYPYAEIVGIDTIIRPDPIEGVLMYRVDAMDVLSLEDLQNFDIIVDDGGHDMLSQQVAFKQLYHNQLMKDGFYVMEDLQTSFIPQYQNAAYTTYNYLMDNYEPIVFNKNPEYNHSSSISFIIPKT